MTPDFAALARIHAEGFDRGWSAEEIARLAESDATIFRALPETGAPRGFILMQCVAGEAEILTLVVAGTARGQGLGRALLLAAEAAAAERGANRAFLDVSDRNEAALRLYRSAGYSEAGRRARYYSDGSDALLMEKALPGLDGAE